MLLKMVKMLYFSLAFSIPLLGKFLAFTIFNFVNGIELSSLEKGITHFSNYKI